MASQQRRRRGLPQPDTDANGKSDANAGKSDANAGKSDANAGKSDADSYAYGNRDGDKHSACSADAKAAAHAVSSADAAVTASE
jgi:hypothetical protein